MKRSLILVTICLLALLSSQANAFERQSQFEFFGGFAIPLAPDGFKDFYKMGLSAHAQYVIFPHPRLGISFGGAFEFLTFDNDAYIEDLDYYLDYHFSADEYSTEGSASIIELGIGVRPYLTSPMSSFQIFLFGMGTFNIFNSEVSETYDFWGYDAYSNYVNFIGDSTYEANSTNIGFAAGAGIEVPAGSVNVILQGLIRFIPAKRSLKSVLDESWASWGIPWEDTKETHSFLGLTAGIVF